ncbi:MAG: cistern family PEP-CTERM protein [Phenylobacterium sp.]|uniref:cistern family PEP-CTERM protein n=1 Tax=Phenylobacterium sp. TaxID=1871053 RepID=UPI001A5A33B9|nr:cistern family PEP-CTERM protein [Phenylobacterium sp.]MBL8771647.1 cistern family PEP-CTERM protein [Phenylobacterium sp.]
MRNVFGGLAVAAAIVAATPAAAAVTLEFNPSWGSTENTGATATATFTFTDVGSNVQMDLVLANTTDGTDGLGATAATLVAFAFDLPTFTGLTYSSNGTTFTKLWTNPSLPPLGTFDRGISLNRNSFGGGNPGGGVTAGNSLGMVRFTVDTILDAAAFESAFAAGYLANGTFDAAVRFQQVNAGGGSDKVLGGLPPPPDPPPTIVPEPSTWALMIMGFMGAGMVLRRRRAVTA